MRLGKNWKKSECKKYILNKIIKNIYIYFTDNFLTRCDECLVGDDADVLAGIEERYI